MDNTNKRRLSFTHEEIETLQNALLTAVKNYEKTRDVVKETTEYEPEILRALTAKADNFRSLYFQITNSEKDV